VSAFLLALAVVPAAARDRHAPAYGDKACADAMVTARMMRVDFDLVRSGYPDSIIFKTMNYYHVRVTHVAFGAVKTGKLEILSVRDISVLNNVGSVWNLYLQRHKRAWHLADCKRMPTR
jgi:hypothetical protein